MTVVVSEWRFLNEQLLQLFYSSFLLTFAKQGSGLEYQVLISSSVIKVVIIERKLSEITMKTSVISMEIFYCIKYSTIRN